eukprot:492341-Rhodomonas_salina.4
MAESGTGSEQRSNPAPAPASAPAPALALSPAPALALAPHCCNHLVCQVAAADEDCWIAEGQLALAEHRVAHPNDFLKPKGVHPKGGSGVVPPHESPLQCPISVGLVFLDEGMIGGKVASDVAGPDLD